MSHPTQGRGPGQSEHREVISWLLASDPSIRWQVMRDLLDLPKPQWRVERSKVDEIRPDPRLGEAIQYIRSRRRVDGRWDLDWTPEGRTWFDLEDHPGKPSRWITLRALRVLRWADDHV